MAETVLGAIPDARIKTGLLKSEAWVLVVTDQRLLGARVTDELMKHVVEQARAQAKASGSGFFGQWGAQIKSSFTLGQRFCAMTPEGDPGRDAGELGALARPGQLDQGRARVSQRWR